MTAARNTSRGINRAAAGPPLSIPPGFAKRAVPGGTLIVNARHEAPLISSGILTRDITALRSSDARSLSGGRGSAFIVVVPGIGDVVIRRYLRGGLIGKLCLDSYLFPTRPTRELAVLAYARSRDVPVPEVLGASVMSAGLLGYRGRIATRMIPDSRTLPVFIVEKGEDGRRITGVLRKSGAAIRRMHEAGIAHADLNMNNILIASDGAPFIIDFDKATVHRELGTRNRLRNLRRLLRSARKLAGLGLGFSDADYETILEGYCGGDRQSLERLKRSTVGSRLACTARALLQVPPSILRVKVTPYLITTFY